MSGSGSFAASRSDGADHFHDPPAIRRHRQVLQLQQLRRKHQQVQRPVKLESAAAAENRTETDDSTATQSVPPVVCSSSPCRPPTDAANLDRLVESVTPSVPALYFSECFMRDEGKQIEVPTEQKEPDLAGEDFNGTRLPCP